jgi:murein tripeptide amidase MpaA
MQKKYFSFISGIFIFLLSTVQLFSQMDFHMDFLNTAHEQNRFCTVPLRELKHQDVERMLKALDDQFPQGFHYEKIGESVEGRSINLVTMGTGETKILLWSQMHGDEPTATAALFDIFYYLLKFPDEPFVKDILDNTTI